MEKLLDVELFRLKAELKILRKMYEEHMRVSQETLEMTYKKKVKTNLNQQNIIAYFLDI